MKQHRWLLLVLAAFVFVGMIDVIAAVVWLKLRPSRGQPIVYAPSAHPTSPWRGSSSPHYEETEESPKLPAIKRNVPTFDVRLLDGCSKTDLDTIDTQIEGAIDIGAPLYNDGDFDGCYRAYDSAAQSIERVTQKTCKGPASALKTGRERAAKLTSASARAWAMRDAFDGVLNVIARKGPEL